MKKYRIFLSIFIIYILINMALFPSLYISRTLDGLSAWAFNVLPSVLPFIFFIKLLTSLNILEKFTKIFSVPCQKLFKTPASSSLVFFTSIISGYPVGAKMTAELFESGKISKSDAFKMCSFCSTSGPMFIIGTVGITMLGQAVYGYIIFFSHIIGALINGILYRNLKVNNDEILTNKVEKKSSSLDLSSIVLDSALSMIIVGTIIAIFFVIITSLSPIFNLFPSPIASILEGIVEITKGCIGIASSWQGKWAIAAATFIISFGGISTVLQSITMLSKLKMPITLFILQKLTHAIIACLISIVFIILI